MPSAYENDLIKIQAYFSFCVFPKPPVILGSEGNVYGITKWEVAEALEGIPEEDSKGTITITGDFYEEPQRGTLYTILAKKLIHPTYGVQYNLIYINEQIDLKNLHNQKAFLSSFLTNGQIEELYKVYDSPLEIIEAHDVEGLKKVHGIGDYVANCIINRFEDNKDMSKVYAELNDYGLTPNFIRKLAKTYRSPSALIQAVKEHPYQLIHDIDGIGFKTADDIALRGGMSPTDVKRVEAYIHYFLETEATDHGNSYVTAGELLTNIYTFFGGKENIVETLYDEAGEVIGTNISVAINNLQKSKDIMVEDGEDKSRRRVYLTYYYSLEQEIAKHLKRLLQGQNNFNYDDWETKVAQAEEKQGFKFDSTQMQGIKLGLDKQVCFITGGAGCVDADTEFFNGATWKKISEYQTGDKVLQWNINNTAELVEPIHYIKQSNINGFNVVRNKNNSVFQRLSDNHLVSYTNAWNPRNVKLIKCGDLVQKHNSSARGFSGRIRTNFMYNGLGINYSDEEIQLFVKTYFKAPIREKHFSSEWYNCSLHQKEIIFQEIFEWDGTDRKHNKVLRNSFSTKNKQDADFIQFVCVSMGYSASIYYYKSREEYSVNIANRQHKLLSLRAKRSAQKQQIQKTQSLDGYEYCFEVPSGYLILRCEGHVFVTHNCGKSSLVSGILAALCSYSFAQVALSGKAAARLQEVTGAEGSTIHRLLGYNPTSGDREKFTYNEDNPLPYDIIVLDEVSLVGGEIFLSLIKAIPSGSKLIMLGDLGQLESIGALNLAADFYSSSVIPTVELKEIHRQASKSGIITSAHQIRNNIQLFSSSTYEGTETIGELQDMIFDIKQEREENEEKTVGWFKQWFQSNLVSRDIMKIQIISPVKERGNTCVYNLNNRIQEYYNPIKKGERILTSGSKDKPYNIHVGDKVMCIKNNYKAKAVSDISDFFVINGMVEEKVCPVFNGWVGIVKEIQDSGVIVDFPLAGSLVSIEYGDAKTSLVLGYASTVHKLQGSDAPVVIGVLDYSTPPSMLTCQLLYTLITRAKKMCVVIGQSGAIYKAIGTDYVSQKRTFLPELLGK